MEQTQSVDELRAAGLNERTIARLIDLRERVTTGERSELTLAHKYLLFVKYLRESERLDELQSS